MSKLTYATTRYLAFSSGATIVQLNVRQLTIIIISPGAKKTPPNSIS